jgi:hypothetical protein
MQVRSVIQFLNAKGECLAEIHKQIVAMNYPKVGLMFTTNKGVTGHL